MQKANYIIDGINIYNIKKDQHMEQGKTLKQKVLRCTSVTEGNTCLTELQFFLKNFNLILFINFNFSHLYKLDLLFELRSLHHIMLPSHPHKSIGTKDRVYLTAGCGSEVHGDAALVWTEPRPEPHSSTSSTESTRLWCSKATYSPRPPEDEEEDEEQENFSLASWV